MDSSIAESGSEAQRNFAGSLIRPAASIIATAIAIIIIFAPSIPLGLPGEWVWNRTGLAISPFRLILPAATFAAFLLIAVLGKRLLHYREAWIVIMLPLLVAEGGIVQWMFLDAPFAGGGVERWPIALGNTASSGYYTVAREIHDTRKFVAEYDQWIERQDVFHVGTHPPGLFLLYRGLLSVWDQHEDRASALLKHAPTRLRAGLDETARLGLATKPAEQAALLSMIALTLAANLLAIVPLYLLLRMGSSPSAAWVGSCYWPLVPAGILFYPLGDCLFPFFSALIVALAAASARHRFEVFAVLGGVVFALALTLSLAFLAILPVIAIAILTGPADAFRAWRIRNARIRRAATLPKNVDAALASYEIACDALASRDAAAHRIRSDESPSRIRWLASVLAFVAGAGLVIEFFWHQLDLNLLTVWKINLAKHAGFYSAMPRSYWTWIGLNLVEFGVVLGPALAVAVLFAGLRQLAPTKSIFLPALLLAWVATIVALDLSGRNLSEVARLWIFLTPLACAGPAWLAANERESTIQTIVALVCQGALCVALILRVEPLLPVALS